MRPIAHSLNTEPQNTLPIPMKNPHMKAPSFFRLGLAAVFALLLAAVAPSALAANPADWKPFTTNSTTLNWSDSANWTVGTGIPTSGTSLVINFDPSKAGTTTSGGGISAATINSNNDLGTVQLNTLNLAGASNGSARAVNITGGTLQFGGSSPSINNTTTGGAGALVNYTVSSNILLDANFSVSLGGTGLTTLVAGAGTTLSANSAGLKTVTVSGGGNAAFGTTSTSVISNGLGQVGITMNGTGVLTMGGANTFTGDLLINSGTVATTTSSAGSTTNLGSGNAVKLGAAGGAVADATLQLGNFTYGNFFTIQSGNAGAATVQNTGSAASTFTNVVTVDKDVTFVGLGTGTFTFTGGLTGAGDVTLTNNGTGNFTINAANPGFTGDVSVTEGIVRVANAAALSSANTVAVDTGATFNTNANAQTVAGLNNGTNGGGTVTNTGAAKVLTLGGSSTYSFGGNITATTTANMALTVALTGSGKQTLTGNSDYDGATLVNAGTLIINGDNSAANGAVTVAAGATLGGSGIVGGATTVNGILSAGNSPGTLTFSSDLTLNNGSTAIFEGGDLVNVNGTLDLNDNWTLTLTGNGFQNGGSVVLFDYATLALSPDLLPTFDTSGLSFTPGSLTLTNDTINGRIVLNGISVVPEPATWGLLAFSLTTVLVLRRRRH
ncbi:MAG: autotransporter-associated beta strand repeat-containing protein [Terrimicrobiaceae bacterium]